MNYAQGYQYPSTGSPAAQKDQWQMYQQQQQQQQQGYDQYSAEYYHLQDPYSKGREHEMRSQDVFNRSKSNPKLTNLRNNDRLERSYTSPSSSAPPISDSTRQRSPLEEDEMRLPRKESTRSQRRRSASMDEKKSYDKRRAGALNLDALANAVEEFGKIPQRSASAREEPLQQEEGEKKKLRDRRRAGLVSIQTPVWRNKDTDLEVSLSPPPINNPSLNKSPPPLAVQRSHTLQPSKPSPHSPSSPSTTILSPPTTPSTSTTHRQSNWARRTQTSTTLRSPSPTISDVSTSSSRRTTKAAEENRDFLAMLHERRHTLRSVKSPVSPLSPVEAPLKRNETTVKGDVDRGFPEGGRSLGSPLTGGLRSPTQEKRGGGGGLEERKMVLEDLERQIREDLFLDKREEEEVKSGGGGKQEVEVKKEGEEVKKEEAAPIRNWFSKLVGGVAAVAVVGGVSSSSSEPSSGSAAAQVTTPVREAPSVNEEKPMVENGKKPEPTSKPTSTTTEAPFSTTGVNWFSRFGLGSSGTSTPTTPSFTTPTLPDPKPPAPPLTPSVAATPAPATSHPLTPSPPTPTPTTPHPSTPTFFFRRNPTQPPHPTPPPLSPLSPASSIDPKEDPALKEAYQDLRTQKKDLENEFKRLSSLPSFSPPPVEKLKQGLKEGESKVEKAFSPPGEKPTQGLKEGESKVEKEEEGRRYTLTPIDMGGETVCEEGCGRHSALLHKIQRLNAKVVRLKGEVEGLKGRKGLGVV
ncbi:hypothetical protein HDV05_008113 [Chytridiales sp. JEL 0842]|nr:hypothetical protein HDV05_008113 [Chytridiales sp. JEL 0842]